MWSHLPLDILSYIFSFLSPDSLARATSVSKHWHTCATARPFPADTYLRRRLPWLVALPTNRHLGLDYCYAHNPNLDQWYALPLGFIPGPVRPITAVDGLILSRATSSTFLQLAIFNPFTKQFRHLPELQTTRTNPAIGAVRLGLGPSPSPSPRARPHSQSPNFRVYVAGGTSNVAHGGATYKSTVEMYDSCDDKWHFVGPMPVELAVRLTVWTPNESVYIKGVLYWVTSARAYSIMGFEIQGRRWMEFGAPMADKLEFAMLVGRNGRLTLVGGTFDEGASIWELGDGDHWNLVERLPKKLGQRFLGEKGGWSGTKCVGSGDGAIWLYRDLRSGMVVWREGVNSGKCEWVWVDGCCCIKGKQIANLPVRGVLLHPNISA
ncbi:hypothetical protein Ancab_029391 [Ancistrocladus abbreviatus]